MRVADSTAGVDALARLLAALDAAFGLRACERPKDKPRAQTAQSADSARLLYRADQAHPPTHRAGEVYDAVETARVRDARRRRTRSSVLFVVAAVPCLVCAAAVGGVAVVVIVVTRQQVRGLTR
jgi:hypothetical protein